MNTQLPNNQKAFTLIELLVVVTIVALISIVAIALFTNTQQDARDGKRKAELESVANALEVNKVTGGGAYQILSFTYFGGNVWPGGGNATSGINMAVDPQNYPYCIASNTGSTPPTALSTTTGWTSGATGACPTGYNTIAGTQPSGAATTWTICARLESRGSAIPYCRSNIQ